MLRLLAHLAHQRSTYWLRRWVDARQCSRPDIDRCGAATIWWWDLAQRLRSMRLKRSQG